MLLQRIFGHLVNLQNKNIKDALVSSLLTGVASLLLLAITFIVAKTSSLEIAVVATIICIVPTIAVSFWYVICFDRLMKLIEQDKK